MATVHELLGAQNMVRMSSSVHVVEDIHLQKEQRERDSALCSRSILHIVCIPVHRLVSTHAQAPTCACVYLVPQQ